MQFDGFYVVDDRGRHPLAIPSALLTPEAVTAQDLNALPTLWVSPSRGCVVKAHRQNKKSPQRTASCYALQALKAPKARFSIFGSSPSGSGHSRHRGNGSRSSGQAGGGSFRTPDTLQAAEAAQFRRPSEAPVLLWELYHSFHHFSMARKKFLFFSPP